MGQAKRRGTLEQRIAGSLGLKKRSLADIKGQLNLPEDAVFLGYGIHLPEPDEFLARFDEQDFGTGKMWVKDPHLQFISLDLPAHTRFHENASVQ